MPIMLTLYVPFNNPKTGVIHLQTLHFNIAEILFKFVNTSADKKVKFKR